jgi:ribosome-binding protein aMBF1 (putative translation factor)
MQTQMTRGNGAATVAGRPREEQPRKVRGTDAGRFGRHLAELIEARGLTVAEFATKIGKQRSVVNHYIRGIRTPPFGAWRRMSKALGLKNVRDLLPDMPN